MAIFQFLVTYSEVRPYPTPFFVTISVENKMMLASCSLSETLIIEIE